MATLRSEFLDQATELAAGVGLPVSTFLLAPLDRDLLPQVIVSPARQAGISIDDELVARLVADTGSGQALPLLAFVLDRLAVGVERGGKLSAARYDDLGGVQGALAAQADSAMAAACAATGRSQADVLAGLLRLVTVDDNGQATRRRVNADDLPAPVRTELEAFIAARLLSADTDSSTGRPVVTVAHEKVLTAWPPLATAITRSAETLRLRRSLEDAAAEWDTHRRPPDHLWEPGRTATAERTLDPSDISPTAVAFLRAGHHHGRRRRIQATAVLSVLLLLVSVGGLLAFTQWRTAVGQRNSADEARLRAVADGLIARADAVRETDPRAALRFGLAAAHVAPEHPPTQASLHETLASSPLRTTLHPETGQVYAVAYSPDGTILATGTGTGIGEELDGSVSGAVILWDVADPQAPRRIGSPLQTHTSTRPVSSLAFSPDGTALATATTQIQPDGSTAGVVVLWDLADRQAPRQIVSPLHANADDVHSVAFSPDGNTLATATSQIQPDGSSAGAVVLWDLADRRNPRQIGNPLSAAPGWVLAVAFSPDGTILAAGQTINVSDGAVVLWDVTDRQAPRQIGNPLHANTLGVNAVAFSPDGTTLATDGADQSAILWDLTDRQNPRQIGNPLPTDAGEVDAVAFSPDGTTLAVGTSQPVASDDADGAVVIWNVTDRQNPRRIGKPLRAHGDWINSIAFAPRTPGTATRPSGRSTLPSDPSTLPSGRSTLPSDPSTLPSGRSTLPSGRVATPNPPGLILATGSSDESVILWDLSDRQAARQIGNALHTDLVGSVAFSPDGTTFAAGAGRNSADVGSGGTVVLWDHTDPRAPRQIGNPLHTDAGDVRSVAFSPDGTTLAAGTAQPEIFERTDGAIVLWDLADRRKPRQIGEPVHTDIGTVISVALSPSPPAPGASAPPVDRGTLRRFPDDGTPRPGTILAAGTSTGPVILWDITDREKPRQIGEALQAHTDRVESVAFSPDGTILATGSDDGSVVLWDLTDRRAPRRLGDPLQGQADFVSSVAFSPDGTTLAAGTGQEAVSHAIPGAVVLWDLTDRQNPRQIGDPLHTDTGAVASVAFSQLTPGTSELPSDDSAPRGETQRDDPVPPGTVLAAGTRLELVDSMTEGAVVLWDLTDRQDSRQIGDPLPIGPVHSVAFSSPARGTSVNPADSSTVRGDPRHDGLNPPGPTLAVATYTSVLDSSYDGAVVLWDFSGISTLWADLSAQACRRAGRALTSQEWTRHVPGIPYTDTCAGLSS